MLKDVDELLLEELAALAGAAGLPDPPQLAARALARRRLALRLGHGLSLSLGLSRFLCLLLLLLATSALPATLFTALSTSTLSSTTAAAAAFATAAAAFLLGFAPGTVLGYNALHEPNRPVDAPKSDRRHHIRERSLL